MTLSVIQNHIREAFITLESFGLSQSFLSSQFSENEVQKPGLPLYKIDGGLFFCNRRTVLHRRKDTIGWDIVVVRLLFFLDFTAYKVFCK